MTKSVLRFGMRVGLLGLLAFTVAGCEFLQQFSQYDYRYDNYQFEKSRNYSPPH